MKGITVGKQVFGVVVKGENFGSHSNIDVFGVIAPIDKYGGNALSANLGSGSDYDSYWVWGDGEWVLFGNGEEVEI